MTSTRGRPVLRNGPPEILRKYYGNITDITDITEILFRILRKLFEAYQNATGALPGFWAQFVLPMAAPAPLF